MAASRFIKDTGLTVRMTTVMFLLAGLFVALVVGVMYAVDVAYAPFVAIAGIGVAFWQWWSSDKV
ncbi:MAG: zinc metalloprotease HtpX, partial [Nocardioides sp.]|nr:zinc metalloprotease HtpX [Nocardioides sp.]